MHDLAWGPKRKVHTWPTYFVNHYKFHTEKWSVGKKTINSGVCVKGSDQGDEESYYYGILKEIVQLEYPGHPMKRLVLFNCEWFDIVMNRGMKVHKQYGIVEIRHTRRYARFDPFIFAENAIQVYYLPYPEKIRDKVQWWVVIKTKPRGTVDDRYTLEVAYQDNAMSHVDTTMNDDPLENLRDIDGGFEEVEGYDNTNLDINEEDVEEEDVEDDAEEEDFDDNDDSEDEDENHDQYDNLSDDDE